MGRSQRYLDASSDGDGNGGHAWCDPSAMGVFDACTEYC
jgi:hypothetical protein